MRLRGEIKLLCPCCDCQNFIRWKDVGEVKSHLIRYGFKQRYTRWTKHGESVDAEIGMNLSDLGTNVDNELQTENVENIEPTENINSPQCNDELDEMMNHVPADFIDDVPDIFENLHKDSNIFNNLILSFILDCSIIFYLFRVHDNQMVSNVVIIL
jgi:Transposase-associated domain